MRHYVPAFADAPIALGKALKELDQGELTLRLKHEELEILQQHVDRARNRLSLSLLIGATVIGSSIVMAYKTGSHFEGIPPLGIAGYAIATALGLWWAIGILRSGRL